MAIPRNLHFFFDRTAEDPPFLTQWRAVLKGHCWTLNLWEPRHANHRDTPWLIANKAWATLADVMRLQALVNYGGLYLDTDFILHRPPDRAFLGRQACVGLEGAHSICNAAMAGRPRHPFFIEALKRIRAMDLKAVVECGHANLAGPVLMTGLFRDLHGQWPESAVEDGWQAEDIDLLPQRVFYPYLWNEPPRDPFPDTIATHLWSGSWKKDRHNPQPTA